MAIECYLWVVNTSNFYFHSVFFISFKIPIITMFYFNNEAGWSKQLLVTKEKP